MTQLDDVLQAVNNVDLVELVRSDMNLVARDDVLVGGRPNIVGESATFIVAPRTQTWRDIDSYREFALNYTTAGDAIDYVRRRDRVDFVEALKTLARVVGLRVRWKQLDGLQGWQERREVEELLTWAAFYFHNCLSIKDRSEIGPPLGIQGETFDHLMIGRPPSNAFDEMTEVLGISKKQALSTGLFNVVNKEITCVLDSKLTFPCWYEGRVTSIVGFDAEAGDRAYASSLRNAPKQRYVSNQLADQLFGEDSVIQDEKVIVAPTVLGAVLTTQRGLASVAPQLGVLRREDLRRLSAATQAAARNVFCDDDASLNAARYLLKLGREAHVMPGVDAATLEQLAAGAHRELLRAVDAAPPAEQYLWDRRRGPQAGDAPPPAARDVQFKGEVVENGGRYCVENKAGELTAISSFVIQPTRRIVVDGAEEVIEGNVVCDNGEVYHSRRFPPDAFMSNRGIQLVLKRPDLQWTGATSNLQGVLRLLARADVPRIVATRNLGYFESRQGPAWVWPGGTLIPADSDNALEVEYVDSDSGLAKNTRYAESDAEDVAEIASEVLPQLPLLNAAEVTLPIIGWFFAAPLRPRIQAECGGFPTLFVWGLQGSGKSSLLQDVFWPLVGVVSEPYSCVKTTFTLIKLLSTTNSVPVVLDEYKPKDMKTEQLNTLHRYIRSLYKREVQERGHQDQRVIALPLRAPLCLAGETRPSEPAIVERLITAVLDKSNLTKERIKTFKAVRKAETNRLAAPLIRWLLARDTKADIHKARRQADALIGDREIPPRVREHLAILQLGLNHYTGFSESLGVELPDLDYGGAFEAVLDDLVGSKGKGAKSSLDFFLEKLSTLAAIGKIKKGVHYAYQDHNVAFDLDVCLLAVDKNWSRLDEGERLDKKNLHALIRDNMKTGGYVKAKSELVTFRKAYRPRALVIDLEAAKEKLDLDGFSTE